MKRHLLLILLCVLCAAPVWAQRKDKHDTLRYNQMNEQGVWSVGVAMEPMVGMLHPLSQKLGGGSISSTGIMGFMVEGGYFLEDNLRMALSIGYVADDWGGGVLRWNFYDGYATQSQFKVRLGCHYHLARWDMGCGVVVGNSVLNYTAADTQNGGVNDERFGAESFADSHTTLGTYYELGFMVSPFLKTSAYYSPTIAFGGGYSHSVGARITIYLPFISSVVCK